MSSGFFHFGLSVFLGQQLGRHFIIAPQQQQLQIIKIFRGPLIFAFVSLLPLSPSLNLRLPRHLPNAICNKFASLWAKLTAKKNTLCEFLRLSLSILSLPLGVTCAAALALIQLLPLDDDTARDHAEKRQNTQIVKES